MWAKLKTQPAIGRLLTRYDQLPGRDRQALVVLAVALLLTALYFVVWRPASGFHQQAVNQRENAAELLAWMQSNQSAMTALAATGTNSNQAGPAALDRPEDGRVLMALVTRTASESELSLQRFEPSGEEAVRVWVADAPFGLVAAWLEQLSTRHGVVVEQAAMDRSDEPGVVSVRLTLTI